MSHSMTTPGAPGWIQFVGPKPDAARAFYAKVMAKIRIITYESMQS